MRNRENSNALWITNPGKVIQGHLNIEGTKPRTWIFLIRVLRISGGQTGLFFDIISAFEYKLMTLFYVAN